MDDSTIIQVACCVIRDDYGRLLLLHGTDPDKTWWSTPGGKVEEGESLEQAGVREIQEELGVKVSIDRRLGKALVEFPEADYELHWMSATITSGEPQIMEPDKFDDIDYIEFDDLPSLALSPGTLSLQEKVLSGEVQL